VRAWLFLALVLAVVFGALYVTQWRHEGARTPLEDHVSGTSEAPLLEGTDPEAPAAQDAAAAEPAQKASARTGRWLRITVTGLDEEENKTLNTFTVARTHKDKENHTLRNVGIVIGFVGFVAIVVAVALSLRKSPDDNVGEEVGNATIEGAVPPTQELSFFGSMDELRNAITANAGNGEIERLLEDMLLREEAVVGLVRGFITESQTSVSVTRSAQLFLFLSDFELEVIDLIEAASTMSGTN